MKLDKKIILSVLFAVSLFFSIMFFFEGLQTAIDLFEITDYVGSAPAVLGIISSIMMVVIIICSCVLVITKSNSTKQLLTMLLIGGLLVIFLYFVIGSSEKGGVYYYQGLQISMYQAAIVSVIPMFVAAAVLSVVSMYAAFSKETTHPAPVQSQAVQPAPVQPEKVIEPKKPSKAQLRLQSLLDGGIISQEEFDAMKQELENQAAAEQE